ncbi:MAG: protein adenylyltransferase SelO [Leucobacter sp.]
MSTTAGVSGATGISGAAGESGTTSVGVGEEGLALSDDFARLLPELSVPWRARRAEHPEVLVLNESLARELRLGAAWFRRDRGLDFLTGNAPVPGSRPVAQAYAGHQFGAYQPRLGDGRALLLGEIDDLSGSRRDVHLKGSGPTPFSRGGDGLAVIGPMLREYLMGEAVHALGIPTTRALAVVATGGRVVRDDSLDVLPGALLVRVASSHLRVGSFQYARALGDPELLRRLADFAIERHYPSLASSEQPYLGLLEAVIGAQASLIASWMLVGFVHGVMNTDNMTIAGETIDYGPCAMLDAYDPAAVFSSIDHRGRYAYRNQPGIAAWNLTRFAETLLPLLSDDVEKAKDLAVTALGGFGARYEAAWLAGMRAKLGIGGAPDAVFAELSAGLLGDLEAGAVDYTGAFRALADAARGDDRAFRSLLAAGSSAPDMSGTPASDTSVEPGEPKAPGAWFDRWLSLRPDAAAMDRVNPVYIPRNHLVEEALDAATAGDLGPFERLLDAVSDPFEPRPGLEKYAFPAPPGSRPHVTYCGT